ncbi:unnamed protein product [Echinostoma caproni]|uniref:Transposase n=1 Tax=Echinostoma caproni TaxID=27848 RepID=A0A183BAW4_9TREM|nr:unnamed protein product [Echinostoma caproni]
MLHRKAPTQHVDRATRCRDWQVPSIFDFVVTKAPNDVLSLGIQEPIGKSDYGVLRVLMSAMGQSAPDKYRGTFWSIDQAALIESGRQCSWMVEEEEQYDERQWCRIKNNISALTDQAAPLKVRHWGVPPWCSSKLRKTSQRKQAWRRYRRTETHRDFPRYGVARRTAPRVQNECRRRYEEWLALHAKSNPKAYFNYV